MRVSKHISRRFLSIAALLVFALHSLVPVGYMPAFSATSPFSFTLCDGTDHTHDMMHMDHAMMTSHMHHHMPDGGAHHEHAGICPFSIGAVYSAYTPEAPLAVPFTFAPPVRRAVTAPAFARLVSYPAGSPRSPPAFS